MEKGKDLEYNDSRIPRRVVEYATAIHVGELCAKKGVKVVLPDGRRGILVVELVKDVVAKYGFDRTTVYYAVNTIAKKGVFEVVELPGGIKAIVCP